MIYKRMCRVRVARSSSIGVVKFAASLAVLAALLPLNVGGCVPGFPGEDWQRDLLGSALFGALAANGSQAGADGEQGPAGPQGAPGESGLGTPGAPGAAGADGADGAAGENGTDGSQGEQGPPGETGAAGQQGAAGEQGLAGDDGATGETGPAGANAPLPILDSSVQIVMIRETPGCKIGGNDGGRLLGLYETGDPEAPMFFNEKLDAPGLWQNFLEQGPSGRTGISQAVWLTVPDQLLLADDVGWFATRDMFDPNGQGFPRGPLFFTGACPCQGNPEQATMLVRGVDFNAGDRITFTFSCEEGIDGKGEFVPTVTVVVTPIIE